MATFNFNQKTLKEYRKEHMFAPEGSQIWFIPTLHGGCLQIAYPDNKKHQEFYCKQKTGYQALCHASILIQIGMELNEKWIGMLERAKTAKFKVTVNKKTKEVFYQITIYKF